MPAYVNLIDARTGRIAKLDVNEALQVNLPTDGASAGTVRLVNAEGEDLETTESHQLLTSQEIPLLFDQVDGAALNTNLWTTSTSGMTIAQNGGFISLNDGAAVTANAYAILQSLRAFPSYGEAPLSIEVGVKLNIAPQANSTVELGIGAVSGIGAPTDGAYFRWAPDGTLRCVICSGGSETSAIIPAPAPTVNESHDYQISVQYNDVDFFIDDTLVAIIDTPAGQPFPTSVTRLPSFLRVYNGSSAPAIAPRVYLGRIAVLQQSVPQLKPWSSLCASLGRGSYQSPVTAWGQTANHANSAAPAGATLSNTAAGYTTLGGEFSFAAPAGAATDFALFAFQVPAGFLLNVSSIAISAVSLGAAVGLTPTVLRWGVGVNGSAVSLATAENPPTGWATRRIPLGMQSFLAAALIGTTADDIRRDFDPPLVVDAGRFFHIILRVSVGLATVSQTIQGTVTVSGYFE